jgi:hypothetical protein
MSFIPSRRLRAVLLVIPLQKSRQLLQPLLPLLGEARAGYEADQAESSWFT